MRLFAFIFMLCFSVSGNAFKPKIISVHETYNEIVVNLNKSSKESFFLYGNDWYYVSSAKASGSSIHFPLSKKNKIPSSDCITLKNENHKLIKFKRESRHGFSSTIHSKYYDVLKYLSSNTTEIVKLTNEISSLEKQYSNRKSELSYNRAYRNQSCSIPSKRSYPLRPSTAKCESEYECRQDAKQLCIIKVGGAVGCSELAQKKGYSSVQVSALCSLAFAEMLEQKYSLEDLITDTTIAFVDDLADEGLESDNGFTNILGGLLKLTAISAKAGQYDICKRNYTKKFHNPYKNWQELILGIDNEPRYTFDECTKNNTKKNQLYTLIDSKKNLLMGLQTINTNVIKSLEKIKNKENMIYPTCNP